MHRGYIKIWRKVKDSGLYQLPNAFTLFVYMLTEATHKPVRFGTVELERGQLCSGRHKLANELQVSEQSIRTALEHLHNLEMITSISTNKFTVYTIVNYNNYQDSQPTSNQQTTNEQPTNNQQTTTIQEHKNIRTKETNNSATEVAGVDYSKAFLAFWDLYPNRKNKGSAYKAFKKIKPDEYAAVKSGLEAAKKCQQWIKNNGEFIPHPATWLNARGWEDESKSIMEYNQEDFLRRIGAIPHE